MQKIYPSLPTLAEVPQLQRWQSLLRNAIGDRPLVRKDASSGDRALTLAAVETAVDLGMIVDIGDMGLPNLPAPAKEGSLIAAAVWLLFSQALRGDETASNRLRTAISQLSPAGLRFTIDDNPEPWWQQEMMILHALHSFALRQNDPQLIEKTLAATAFHLAEIQPDHATNEPWAVHAYASHHDGTVTAETLLHAAYMNGGGVLSETSRWILADAAQALEAFLRA